jgi:Ser/Thr protein kinase RdoA (MazF antagonist)
MPGPLLLDVGYALVEYCCDTHGAFDPGVAAAFLRAYNAERPFARDELESGLKKYFATIWIRSLAWLWGSPAHWRRPELMQFGKRVVPAIRAVLDWDITEVGRMHSAEHSASQTHL